MPKATTNGNETRICEAIIQLLEFRLGKTLTKRSSPEDDRSAPPVEMLLEFGRLKFAIEHTLVESFPSQIYTDIIAQRLEAAMHNLQSKFKRNSDRIYYLSFPADITELAKADRLKNFIQELTSRVDAAAETLDFELAKLEKSPWGENVRTTICIQDIDVELQLTTKRRPKTHIGGSIILSRYAPKNLEAARLTRIQTALKNKLPKLQHCKTKGYKTILVLEDQDMQLSNSSLICDAVRRSESTSKLPDEILCVDTCSGKDWYFGAIYNARKWSPKIVLDKRFALYESMNGQFDWSAK